MNFEKKSTNRTNGFISVVIPCYQQGRFLKSCIESLQSQTYKNWEAIIVNDGSTDFTESIAIEISAREPRVRYLLKSNGGLSSARNAGLQHSRGEYVQFLDADDQLENRKFELQVAELEQHPNIDLVYGNAMYFEDGNPSALRRRMKFNEIEVDWISKGWIDSRPMLNKILERNIFPVCAPLVRSEILHRIGLFNESLRALEDWEYWLRLALQEGKFSYLNAMKTDSLIRMHQSNMTRDSLRMTQAEFTARLQCQPLLPSSSRHLRLMNLWRILFLVTNLDSIGSTVRYKNIAQQCATPTERFLCKSFQILDRVGILSPSIKRKLIQIAPIWLRKALKIA